MKQIVLIALCAMFMSCNTKAQKREKEETIFPVTKTEAEWKSELTEMEYYVLREAGTERAFTSELNKNYEPGTYVCAACQTPLFKSEHKFDSGTGWPSFDREIKGNVMYDTDYKLGYGRTEELCASCGGHLGHIFNDGPKDTTGKRHCINGVALDFIPKN
ncbi:MAG: peptide-methionine (R)-S-oxide reductase MsrB [Bacteroidia bacterium]|nr:peptide-methionine (R)-S-oxide reductase MsrB [Bacteroidia bacterium]MBT8274649.1 peptide-methionine (R)-S-oxide reductase MsrB [Bacteroidia bacterium]NNF32136.1 peptide-methionine (R)-S-oxide reductase MsrB [Flavobacteriaceae bacterium]NNK55655.1 peptide-methionine (R)-S-oxide reductase MsrB [Flavobacteriaceae bacterium]NNM08386.1 peptide-methionine (R)-S-oxide reductase MsrB [Flavobacteriaceae bacterium]